MHSTSVAHINRLIKAKVKNDDDNNNNNNIIIIIIILVIISKIKYKSKQANRDID